MSSDNPDNLNYDCNYNMFLAKSILGKLPNVKDRQKAVKWMRKLATCNQSVGEMKLRNDFMYYLVVNIQSNELKAPFIEDPPAGTLYEIAHLLPKGTESQGNLEEGGEWAGRSGAGGQPFIYSNSPDGGAFLAAQPIPRCGAFCYLAVVSRSKN